MAFASPWHALAASSGAPTPTLEFPLTMPGTRDSPKLGQPFERLNLGPSLPPPSQLVFGENLSSPLRKNRNTPSVGPGASEQSPLGNTSVPSGAISGLSRPDTPLRNVQSLAQRRSNIPMPSLSLSSPALKPAPTTESNTSVTPSTSHIKCIDVKDFAAIAGLDSTLIIDLRAPSSFEASHLPRAHSLSVPSTLLRRPGFGLAKVLEMMSPSSRAAVRAWKEKANIVLIDSDSTSVPEGSMLHSMSDKFDREGYTGQVSFVYGGQAQVESDKGFELESTPVVDQAKEASSSPSLGRLSRLAFQNASTNAYHGRRGSGMPQTTAVVRENPFKSYTMPLATGRLGPNTGSLATQFQPANPFFDNIRQNLELSYEGINERIPLALPASVVKRADELPPFLRDLVKMPNEESMELLALQFQRLERNEQKRLQSVMTVLSKGGTPEVEQSGGFPGGEDNVDELVSGAFRTRTGYYPFSITAGVERGAKNRYKNIWPYDFSRVRLGSHAEEDSDYINASFVQPRGTSRRYIATQGPVDATYRDFWTVVWEQDVHVIVMLTKQLEGGHIKCGQYWKEEQYGDLRLQMVSQTGGEDKAEVAMTGFDFGVAAQPPKSDDKKSEPINIKRVFRLFHTTAPEKVRMVTQIQCVAWPDYDVPETPAILLNLMHDVDTAVEELCGCSEDRGRIPPVLVHCSAGIGRTGSFILADAIADGLRSERRAQRLKSVQPGARDSTAEPRKQITSAPRASSPEHMDLDTPAHEEDTPMLSPTPAKPHSSDILAVTPSCKRHRTPTPLSEMSEPVVDVLSAMRVHRMSLVQSLRQYLFVHRTIIAHYLAAIDRESCDTSASVASSTDASTSSTSMSLAGTTSRSTTDDEAHFKRKPSATDLQPQADLRLQRNMVDELRLNDEGSNLAKRASFKKRRG